MKRLVIAACLALGVHVSILVAAPGWLKSERAVKYGKQPIELSLASVERGEKSLGFTEQKKEVQQEVKKERDGPERDKKTRKKAEDNRQDKKKRREPSKDVKAQAEHKEPPAPEPQAYEPPEEEPFQKAEKPIEEKDKTKRHDRAEKEILKAGGKSSNTWKDINQDVLAHADFEAGEGQGNITPPSGEPLKEVKPEYRHNPTPEYPRIAKKRRYEGTVMIKALVNRKGGVEKLRVIGTSGHSVLDRAALSAVRGWDFEPGTRNGKEVDMWVKIPVRFELK